MVNVSNGGQVSETFAITNGVKQGFILALTLFSILLLAMLEEAFRDMGVDVYIQSRQNANLFTVTYFRAKTKTRKHLRELLFADDSIRISHSTEEIQWNVDTFATASSKFGLKINIKKTGVMYQPNSTTAREDINLDDTTQTMCKNSETSAVL